MVLNKYWQGIEAGDEKALESLFKEINNLCVIMLIILPEIVFQPRKLCRMYFSRYGKTELKLI